MYFYIFTTINLHQINLLKIFQSNKQNFLLYFMRAVEPPLKECAEAQCYHHVLSSDNNTIQNTVEKKSNLITWPQIIFSVLFFHNFSYLFKSVKCFFLHSHRKRVYLRQKMYLFFKNIFIFCTFVNMISKIYRLCCQFY